MARVIGSIIGNVRGKVGNVVGGSWKGTPYLRSLVIPANPQTPAQTQQRTKFGTLVAIGKQCLSTIIQPYWDPFERKQSGFNAFIQRNLNDMGEAFDAALLNVCVGSLEGLQDLGKGYSMETGNLPVTWVTDIDSNGHAGDNVAALAYDTVTGLVTVVDSGTLRSEGSLEMSVRKGGAIGQFEVFAFAYRAPADLPYLQSSSGRCQS